MQRKWEYVLASCLLGYVADGSSLLANDGSNVLREYQQSQRDVSMRRFRRHTGAWGSTTGPTSWAIARTSTIIGSPLVILQFRVLIRDIGDPQGVVLKLVSI